MDQIEKSTALTGSGDPQPNLSNTQPDTDCERFQSRQFHLTWVVLGLVTLTIRFHPGLVFTMGLMALGLCTVVFNLLRKPLLTKTPTLCYISTTIEVALVTWLVWITGGQTSVFTPLYLIPVATAATFGSRGILTAGVATSLFFAANHVWNHSTYENHSSNYHGLLVSVFLLVYTATAWFLYREIWRVRRESRDVAENAREIARLYENTAARNREITALQNTVRVVAETMNLSDVLSFVCRELVEAMGFASSMICLVNNDRKVIEAVEGYNVAPELIRGSCRDLEGPDILAEIVRSGKLEVINGWDERFHKETFERFNHISGCRIFAPISLRGEVLGVVEIGHRAGRSAMQEHEIQLLQSFLVHVAVAVGNARHFEEIRRQLEQLRALITVGSAISSTLELKGIMSSVVESTSTLMNSDVCTLRILDGDALILGAQQGLPTESLTQRIPCTLGLAGVMVESQEPLIIPDLRSYQRLDDHRLVYSDSNLRSFIGTPLIAHGELLGILGLYIREVHNFTEREIDVFLAIASQAAVAISNARLYEQIAHAKDDLEEKVKERTQDLAETNERLAAILSGISDGVTLVDRDHTISWVNEVEASRWSDAESLVGKKRQDTNRCEGGESCVECPTRKTFETGQISRAILPARLPNGEVRYYDVVTSPIYAVGGGTDDGAGGMVYQVLEIARDITENRRMEEKLAEYTKKLEQMVEERTVELQRKNEELESFVFTVSHDLKAPIVSIQGFAANLTREYAPKLEGDGEFYLTRIRKNTEQLQSLIQELLELSRIGRLPEPWEPVNLKEMVDDVAGELEFQIENNGIRLDVPSDLPDVVCQRKRFRQVFVNLIDNAIRYRSKEGNPYIRIAVEDTGDSWEFRVQDNGVGIAPENQRKIFQIFQRLHKVPDAKDGAGVGLAIVKKIVETHGGQIQVESEGEGLGSTFVFSIPKKKEKIIDQAA